MATRKSCINSLLAWLWLILNDFPDHYATEDVLVLVFNRLQHTHTHLFNGPLSGTTQVSQYQKGNFTEARDSEWQWHQLDHMQVCTSLQTDNHASTPTVQHSIFYRPAALPATQPTVSKHWRQVNMTENSLIFISCCYLVIFFLNRRIGTHCMMLLHLAAHNSEWCYIGGCKTLWHWHIFWVSLCCCFYYINIKFSSTLTMGELASCRVHDERVLLKL